LKSEFSTVEFFVVFFKVKLIEKRTHGLVEEYCSVVFGETLCGQQLTGKRRFFLPNAFNGFTGRFTRSPDEAYKSGGDGKRMHHKL